MNNITVLLVDDEEDFRTALGFWLQTKGYTIKTAGNGQEGIRVVKEQAPDIVFLDLRMPVMDGEEMLKELRAFNKDLPVIVISAHVSDPQRIKEISAYGISGIFYKGSDFAEGLQLVEAALRTHKDLKK
jgi:two-component system, response regulator, stage 0 sporulation protein F